MSTQAVKEITLIKIMATKPFLQRNKNIIPAVIFVNNLGLLCMLKEFFNGREEEVHFYKNVPDFLCPYIKKYTPVINIHITGRRNKKKSKTLEILEKRLKFRGCPQHELEYEIENISNLFEKLKKDILEIL